MPDSPTSPVSEAIDKLERASVLLGYAAADLYKMKIEEPEIRAVCEHATAAIVAVMQEAAKGKHAPWKWASDHEDEHIRKALRHALTYQLERDGYQKPTGEDHLQLAMTRLCMAYARRDYREPIEGLQFLADEHGDAFPPVAEHP
jgi:hypothetical protein